MDIIRGDHSAYRGMNSYLGIRPTFEAYDLFELASITYDFLDQHGLLRTLNYLSDLLGLTSMISVKGRVMPIVRCLEGIVTPYEVRVYDTDSGNIRYYFGKEDYDELLRDIDTCIINEKKFIITDNKSKILANVDDTVVFNHVRSHYVLLLLAEWSLEQCIYKNKPHYFLYNFQEVISLVIETMYFLSAISKEYPSYYGRPLSTSLHEKYKTMDLHFFIKNKNNIHELFINDGLLRNIYPVLRLILDDKGHCHDDLSDSELLCETWDLLRNDLTYFDPSVEDWMELLVCNSLSNGDKLTDRLSEICEFYHGHDRVVDFKPLIADYILYI